MLEQATPADPRALREAFETSKKQLRALLTQNSHQAREIMTLQRRNRIQQEDMKKARDQSSDAGVQRLRGAYEAKIHELRAEMSSLRASNEDLRSLARSAEILAESLTRELECAKAEAREGVDIAKSSQRQLDDVVDRNVRYERAIKHGQEEIVKLHAYCAQAKGAFEDALQTLQKERFENEMNKRKIADLEKLLNAARLIKAKENEFTLPLR